MTWGPGWGASRVQTRWEPGLQSPAWPQCPRPAVSLDSALLVGGLQALGRGGGELRVGGCSLGLPFSC